MSAPYDFVRSATGEYDVWIGTRCIGAVRKGDVYAWLAIDMKGNTVGNGATRVEAAKALKAIFGEDGRMCFSGHTHVSVAAAVMCELGGPC